MCIYRTSYEHCWDEYPFHAPQAAALMAIWCVRFEALFGIAPVSSLVQPHLHYIIGIGAFFHHSLNCGVCFSDV